MARDLFFESNFWVSLYIQFFGSYTPRSFVANLGVTPEVCIVVWASLAPWVEEYSIRPRHLLYFLSFIKTYDTFQTLATRLRVTERTVRYWVWLLADLLSVSLEEVPLFSLLSPFLSFSIPYLRSAWRTGKHRDLIFPTPKFTWQWMSQYAV